MNALNIGRKRFPRRIAWAGTVATFATVAATSSPLHAQEAGTIAPTAEIKPDEHRVEGFNPSFSLNGNLSITQSDKVVGQLDGVAVLVGVGALGELDWIGGKHEITNRLTLSESFARTPALERFTKNNDLATLESTYTYYFIHWAGAYGRLKFETSVLPTNDVRESDADYVITRLDGSTERRNGTSVFRLADPFQPFTFNQSAGMVARALESDLATVTFRLGASGRETYSKGLLILSDNDATPEIETVELDNVFQAGFEGIANIGGKLGPKLSYGVEAALLLPPINNDPLNRSAVDLMRKTVSAVASYSMLDWLALTYQFRFIDDPQLQDKVQTQNSLLATLQYTLVKKKVIEAEDPLEKAQAEAKAAIDRVTELETSLAESEARRAELEAEITRAQNATPDGAPQPPPDEPTKDSTAPDDDATP
ncbi:MAG: hypothetical protein H6729_11445 [Deltaproteobacteria bacterium]|nr:hypothetical protein [Deltaproteobacteria bacterium]